MLKVIGIIAVIIAVAVVAILTYAATRPDDFRVSRSATIRAAPERIFALIAGMRAFHEWNPFAKEDPAMEIRFSGPETGVGSAQSFEGGRSGKGRLEITGIAEPTSVAMRLDMEKPLEGHNDITFELRSDGENTSVTWTMSGKMHIVSKVIGLFVSMDRMIGGEFDKGLADLTVLAEK